jgi:hypothetical protein
LKNWLLDKKLDDLSCRMADVPVSGSTRIDPNCFSESERLLFRRVEEITQLLEAGFEYVLQKDNLAYFRKRK